MADLVEVGRIVKPHGLRGEVVVELITDREERLDSGSRLEVDRGQGLDELVVVHARRQRTGNERRRARWVVQFEAVTTVELADEWRDAVLMAEALGDASALWVDDLVGSEIVLASDGSRVGSCVSVVANPASDLLELDDGRLVPVVFVVSRSTGRVVIDPPVGLLDL